MTRTTASKAVLTASFRRLVRLHSTAPSKCSKPWAGYVQQGQGREEVVIACHFERSIGAQGAGPSVLAQFALDQDPQGGERMTTSYSPEATRAM